MSTTNLDNLIFFVYGIFYEAKMFSYDMKMLNVLFFICLFTAI